MNKLNSLPKFLTTLKTNYIQNHEYAFCEDTKINRKLLLILYKEKLIRGFKKDDKLLKIKLRYYRDQSLISNSKTIYKASIKKYSNVKKIKKYEKKFDIFFLSTNFGLISSNDLIKFNSQNIKVGGQLLFGIDLMNKNI